MQEFYSDKLTFDHLLKLSLKFLLLKEVIDDIKHWN